MDGRDACSLNANAYGEHILLEIKCYVDHALSLGSPVYTYAWS